MKEMELIRSIKPLIEAISKHKISIDDKIGDYDELLDVLNSIYRNIFCLQTITNWKMIQDKIPDGYWDRKKKMSGYIVTCGNEFILPENIDEKVNDLYEDLEKDFAELYSMLEFYRIIPDTDWKDALIFNGSSMIEMMNICYQNNTDEYLSSKKKPD